MEDKNTAPEYIIELNDVTVRYNKASEKIDNLKEYFVKLIRHELMYQEFLALKNIDLKIKRGGRTISAKCGLR